MRKIIIILIIAALVTAVVMLLRKTTVNQEAQNESIVVSIYPLKYIATRILEGTNIEISVLVPPGSSPETFEPTPKQMIDIESSNALFTIGLIDFENELSNKLKGHTKLFTVSDGIEVLEGHCSHAHNGEHHHHHGIDPHVWTSPKQLKIIAANMFSQLSTLYPDLNLAENYELLQTDIAQTDSIVTQMIGASEANSFIIYHPAFTYYANDYGIKQISIEDEGKEPSIQHLKEVITRAKAEGITKILYQSEFSTTTINTAVQDTGTEAVEVNPLSEDVLNNIIYITKLITNNETN